MVPRSNVFMFAWVELVVAARNSVEIHKQTEFGHVFLVFTIWSTDIWVISVLKNFAEYFRITFAFTVDNQCA